MECSMCGAAGTRVRLFKAVSDTGIVGVCEQCAIRDDMPIVKKPSSGQLRDVEKAQSTYERLSRIAGVEPSKLDFSSPIKDTSTDKGKEEVTLKNLVEKNFNKGLAREAKPRPDLIDNFHWTIMRARRTRKITQEQLAKEIHEAESAIQMAEKGILPEDDNKLIGKLEAFLGIKLQKTKIEDIIKRPEPKQFQSVQEQPLVEIEKIDEIDIQEIDEDIELARIAEHAEEMQREEREAQKQKLGKKAMSFDPMSAKTTTIGDLKKMRSGSGHKPSKKEAKETE
ncbi:multiprotein-bridging factor 1 family protein [Nanoarchaeota archaeon]